MTRGRARSLAVLMAVLLGAAVAPPALAVTGVTYVVATTGSDANDCLSVGTACGTVAGALAKAADGDTVEVGAGTYTERFTISKRVDVVGTGTAESPTVIVGDGASGPVITVAATGTSSDTLRVANLTVRGALGSGNTGAGILVSAEIDQEYIAIDSVTSTANAGHGIAFNSAQDLASLSITDSIITANGGSGIRVASAIATLTGLTIDDCTVEDNALFGLDFNPSGNAVGVTTVAGTGLVIVDTAFNRNGAAGTVNLHDVSILGFNGDLTMTRVTVTGIDTPAVGTDDAHGIAIGGKSPSAGQWLPAGTISLTDVTLTGRVGKAGLYLLRYSDVSAVSMSGVDLSGVVAPWGQLLVEAKGSAALNIGNMTLVTAALSNSAGVNATGAQFRSASDVALRLVASASHAQAFQIANQVVDGVDISGLGLVRILSDTIVTTTTSYFAPNTSARLQYAQALAAPGDTVMAEPGSYYEGTVGGDGSLELNQSLRLGDSVVEAPVTMSSGTLSGSGTIEGSLTIGTSATLAPGSSPGVIASGNYVQDGALSIDVVSGSGLTYPVAGSDYDQVDVTGSVVLGAASTLAVNFSGTALASPAEFVIIRNDGTDPVTGTFAGLAEGAIITSGVQSLALSYSGGDGNDVTLSLLAQAAFSVSATSPQKYGATQTVSASGGSGTGALSYSVSGDCTITGADVTMTSGSGTCTVTATRAASGAYLEATDSAVIAGQKRTIVVTANNVTIGYGQAVPTYDFTLSGDGFVGDDDFSAGPMCGSVYAPGDPIGTYPITCTAEVSTADSANYSVTTAPGTLTVTPAALPAGAVEYIGLGAFQSKSTTDTSLTVPLEATVDVSGLSGEVSLSDAAVTFTDAESGTVLAKNVPISVNGDDTSGLAVAWATLKIGSTGLSTYLINVTVSGSLTGDNATQSASSKQVTVALPATTTGTISGLGLLVPATRDPEPDQTPSGALVTPAYDGALVSFHFQAYSTSKRTASPKGQLIASWAGPAGATYWMKSNAITAVSPNASASSAVVTFKASLWVTDSVGTVTGIDGNVLGRVELLESGNQLGLTAQSSKTSALYLSTNWVKDGRRYATLPVPTEPGVGLGIVIN